MVNLELFKKCIQHIKAQQAKDEVLSDVLVCEDSRGWVSTADELIDDAIDLIAEGMTGEDTDDWISWYLWEIDMDKPEGERNNHVWIKNEEDGLTYKYTINDVEDLYYLITDELDKIKEKVQEDMPENKINPTVEHPNFTGETLYDVYMRSMNGYTETEN